MILEASASTVPVGDEMLALASRLFPVCRSLTGDGVRETLRALGEHIPIDVHEVPSGTAAFDWIVPPEWNIRGAYIQDASGRRVVDFSQSNLHVLGYSTPVRARMSLSELQAHLHSLPEQPNLIPYRTSYYQPTWGFCLPHTLRQELKPGDYEVCVDSTLAPGHLSYGECVLKGELDDEVLVYAHTCHPSLANDNISGLVVSTFLARWLAGTSRRYSYRFVFGPGAIGSLVWLSRNLETLGRIKHGLVMTLLGHGDAVRYKCTRDGATEIDQVAEHVLRTATPTGVVDPFSPCGYDERQFGAPGFRLPVGRLSRSLEGGYPEYHTSADNLALIGAEALADSYRLAQRIISVLERNVRYVNTAPYGEPQLGRRGLYRPLGGLELADRERALLWLLNLSDGSHSLLDIANQSTVPFDALCLVADELTRAGLLAVSNERDTRAHGAGQ
jgi:aminopeptidase-like protein